MLEALRGAKVPETSYAVLTIPAIEEHGFEYWDSYDNTLTIFGLPPDVPRTVHDDVIHFLEQNLKQCSDCPNSKLAHPTERKNHDAIH
jgi:hypothetical protein